MLENTPAGDMSDWLHTCVPRVSCLAAAGLFASLVSAQSQELIGTDRPTQSAATLVLAPGTFQIESGYKFSRSDEDNGNVTDVHGLPDALFRIGVLDGVEARVTMSGWSFRSVEAMGTESDSRGFNDVSIGAKFAVAEGDGAKPSFSILADVGVPVGSDGFSNDYVNPKVLALMGGSLSDRWGWTINFGPSFVEENEASAVDLEYAVALGAAVGGRASFFAEFYGAWGVSGERLDQHSFQTGMVALLSDNVQIDGRGGVGFVDNVPTWLTGFGISWRPWVGDAP